MTLVCAWDGGTRDVRDSEGELLCADCRYVINYRAVLSALPE